MDREEGDLGLIVPFGHTPNYLKTLTRPHVLKFPSPYTLHLENTGLWETFKFQTIKTGEMA